MDSPSSESDLKSQSQTRKMCLACNENFAKNITHCPKDGTLLITVGSDENIGKLINGRFKVIELIGKGGMGSVYSATDLQTKQKVAIKMLHAQLSEDKQSVKRFQQEANASADLKHKNLITQIDYGMIDEKQPWIAMEYLEGESLIEIIHEEGQISPPRVCKLFEQIMDGLYYAHQKGIVHRDIKPSNILIIRNKQGEEIVKVLDFGLAKLMPWSGKESQHLTKTGDVFGSPVYMSPEQCTAQNLEPSSDIYSLGITLFEALTGKPPFRGQNVIQTASKHLSEAPPTFESIRPDLNLPLNLQSVVFKALEKEPAHRFLSMNEFREALIFAITGLGSVSTRAQAAAMAADATQQVSRVDIETQITSEMLRKSVSNLRLQEPIKEVKQVNNTPFILAGVLAFIVLSTAAWFFVNQNSNKTNTGEQANNVQTKEITGTIYYILVEERKNSDHHFLAIKEIHLMTKNGLLKLAGQVKISRLPDLGIGKIWQIAYKEIPNNYTLEKYLNTDEENSDICASVNVILNFFTSMADGLYEEALRSLSKKYTTDHYGNPDDSKTIKNLAAKYKKEDLKNIDKFKSATDSLSTISQALSAAKVQSASQNKIEILVDSSILYSKKSGYERFTLNRIDNDWQITNIEQSVPKAEWDKY